MSFTPDTVARYTDYPRAAPRVLAAFDRPTVGAVHAKHASTRCSMGDLDERDGRLFRMLMGLGMARREAFEHVVILNLTGALQVTGVTGKALTRLGVAVLDGQRRMTGGEAS